VKAHELRDVVLVWCMWAALTLVAVAVAGELGVITPHADMRALAAGPHGVLWLLRGWDYGWYTRIADSGYSGKSYAFFPLWPGVLWALGRLGDRGSLVTLWGVVVSALAFAGVAFSSPSARRGRTALALACMPGSFALLLGYSDGIALVLATAATIAAARRHWALAALSGFLTALARPNGFLIALLLFGLALRGRGRMRWLAVVAPPAGFVAVNVGFWISSGTPRAFVDAEKQWGRGYPTHLFGSVDDPWAVVQAAVAAAALVLLVLLWRSRRRYGVFAVLFAAAVIALSLTSGTFAAFSRQMLFAFPLVWVASDLHARVAWAAALGGAGINVAGIVLLPHFFP
jgi:hypothetical protein